MLGDGVQMWFIVPMVGQSYSPIYVTCDPVDALATRIELNMAMGGGPDMFEVECLYNERGGINFDLYRDADRMCWVDTDHGQV